MTKGECQEVAKAECIDDKAMATAIVRGAMAIIQLAHAILLTKVCLPSAIGQ